MTYFEICTQLYSLETLMTEEQVYLEQIFKKAKDISFSQRTFKDEGSESLLSSTKRKNVFSLALREFFSYLLKQIEQLSIFIDDAQDIDQITLSLLHEILQDRENIQLILAYRGNEVGKFHPIEMFFSKKDIDKCEEIRIPPLSKRDITQLISETLSLEEDRGQIKLAEVVFNKTHGVPLHIVHFFKNLTRNNLLFFNS